MAYRKEISDAFDDDFEVTYEEDIDNWGMKRILATTAQIFGDRRAGTIPGTTQMILM